MTNVSVDTLSILSQAGEKLFPSGTEKVQVSKSPIKESNFPCGLPRSLQRAHGNLICVPSALGFPNISTPHGALGHQVKSEGNLE